MNYLNLLLAATIVLLMLQSGLSLRLVELRHSFHGSYVRTLLNFCAINFLLIPFLTWLYITQFTGYNVLGLTLLTMALLPCAPIVPSIATALGDKIEWPIMIFISCSLIALVIIISFTILLANNSTISQHHSNSFSGLLRYMLLVYVPLISGIMLRKISDSTALTMLKVIRRPANIVSLLSLVLFSVANFAHMQSIPLNHLAVLLLFSLFCVLLVLPFSNNALGPPNTRILATGFRNIALAMPFSILLLHRPDVTVYIIVSGLLSLLVCTVTLLLLKQKVAGLKTN